MLEIIVLVALTNHIGRIVEAKGYRSGKYKWMTVGLWFGGEIVGAIMGSFMTGSESGTCVRYIIALLGAAAGAVIANSIANNLQAMPGYPLPSEGTNQSGKELATKQSQLEREAPINAVESEQQRVERLGIEVAVCLNCQTINSLALLNCEKCHTNLAKVKPIRNPYL
jgi:hypothetical protein